MPITLVQSAYGTTSATFASAATPRNQVIVVAASSGAGAGVSGNVSDNYVRVGSAQGSNGGTAGTGIYLDVWRLSVNTAGLLTITPSSVDTVMHTSIYEFSGVSFFNPVFGTSTTSSASVTSTAPGSLFFAAGYGNGTTGTFTTGWTHGHSTVSDSNSNTFADEYIIVGTAGPMPISGMNVGGTAFYLEAGFAPPVGVALTRVSSLFGF